MKSILYNRDDISLIVPSYNEEKHIESCIYSIINQSVAPGEVIFVDNSSSDLTIKKIENVSQKIPARVKILIEDMKGIPFARNRGIKESTGRIVVFLDSDCEAPSKYIEWVLEDFNSEKVSAVAGRYVLDGSNLKRAKYREVAWSRHFGWNQDSQIMTEMKDQVGTIVSGCSAFVKDVFDKVGPYDVRYLYMDDIAFSKKFYKTGFRAFRDVRIQIKHHIDTGEIMIFKKDIRYGGDQALINRYIDKIRFKFFVIHYKILAKDIFLLLASCKGFYLYEIRTLIYFKIGLFSSGFKIGCIYI